MKYVPMTDDELWGAWPNDPTLTTWQHLRCIEQAVLARIEAQGLVMVPREPTDAMVSVITNERVLYDSAQELYKAMLEATKEST